MNATASPRIRLLQQESAFTRLAGAKAVGSPFQSAGWLKAWLEASGGMARFRVVEVETTGGIWLLPVELMHHAGGRVARKVGGGHASYFTPLRLGAPPPLDAGVLAQATRTLEADALLLTDCPALWAGSAPFAPPMPAAPDIARRLDLLTAGPFEGGEKRKKLRAKARKLAELGALEAGFVEAEAAHGALAAMLGWKAQRLGARGIADPFAADEVQRFLRAGLGAGGPLRLFALHLAGRPVAGMVLAQTGGHASGMANAHDPAPRIERCGPGDVLLHMLVEALAQEGVQGFDLGVGDAHYKRKYCPDEMPLVDVFAAGTLKGKAIVAAHALARRAKGALKRNAAAYAALTSLRGRFFARG